MQQLNSGFGLMAKGQAATQAFSMIGKQIDYADTEAGMLSGKVTGVSFEDGSPKLDVGKTQVELANVIKVY